MKLFLPALSAAFALFATSSPAMAGDEPYQPLPHDPTIYPCDVFSFSFCFRKPYGTHFVEREGPDFSILEVSDEQGAMFQIYAGTAPQKTPENAKVVLVASRRNVVAVASSFPTAKGGQAIDIQIAYRNGLRLHVFGIDSKARAAALAETMSTFRLCKKRGFTSIDCEKAPLFEAGEIEKLRLPEIDLKP